MATREEAQQALLDAIAHTAGKAVTGDHNASMMASAAADFADAWATLERAQPRDGSGPPSVRKPVD
jgi:hypothetical protein